MTRKSHCERGNRVIISESEGHMTFTGEWEYVDKKPDSSPFCAFLCVFGDVNKGMPSEQYHLFNFITGFLLNRLLAVHNP